jgi:hypothetical protein
MKRSVDVTALNVAREFSVTPGGRYRRISQFSGEEFRETLLEPALRGNEAVEVELDGVLGYGSSFLEEVFGGIVRVMHWTSRQVFDRHIRVTTTRGSWRAEVDGYVDDALALERSGRHN